MGATDDVTTWRIRVTFRIKKATCKHAHAHAHALGCTRARPRAHTHTHTHTHVILIAFSRQQLFRERASMLLYTYIACLVQNSHRDVTHILKSYDICHTAPLPLINLSGSYLVASLHLLSVTVNTGMNDTLFTYL
jgi:hypothetical protein